MLLRYRVIFDCGDTVEVSAKSEMGALWGAIKRIAVFPEPDQDYILPDLYVSPDGKVFIHRRNDGKYCITTGLSKVTAVVRLA